MRRTFPGGETRPCLRPCRRTRSRAPVTAALALFLGCDLSSSRPPEVPEPGYVVQGSEADTARAEPSSDGRVTLAEALAYARGHAPDAVVAAAEVELGEAEVIAAQQAQPFNPTLRLGLGQRRQAGGTGLDAHVALTQQLEIASQRRKRRERAQIYRELTRIGIDAAAWSVHADVHQAFETALLADERELLANERLRVAKELLRIAERRVEVGEESTLVVEVAKAEVAVAENGTTAAAADVETSRLGLGSAIGWMAPIRLQPVGTLDEPASAVGGAELVRGAAESSPALRQVEARKRIAEADVASAKREAWPSPTFGVSFAREGSTTTPANFNPPSTIWMGTIEIPIPSFARNQGPVARSRAQVKVARARKQAVSVKFNAMVGTTVTRVNASARRSAALEGSVLPAFERSLADLRRSYDVGEMGYLEVAQALDRLWVARQEALDARAAYYQAFADLERLVGPLDSRGVSTGAQLLDAGERR